MAYSYDQVVTSQAEMWHAEHAAANAEMERCRLVEDPDGLSEAIARMYRAQQNLQTLNATVEGARRQQAQPAAGYGDLKREQVALARKYGLTPDEAGVAFAATSDPRIDDAERAMSYARGKERLRELRASGYRDEVDERGGRR